MKTTSLPSRPRKGYFRNLPGCRRRFASPFLVALAALLYLVTPNLQAAVIINLPNNVNGGSTVTSIEWKAMLFTTGSVPTVISSIQLGLNPYTGGTPPITPNVHVSIFSVAANMPAVELMTTGLVSVDMQANQGVYSFPAFAGFSLAASTPYALVLSSDSTGIKWGRNDNNNPTATSGFQYDTFLISPDSGSSWSTTSINGAITMDNAVSISVVPEPSTWLIMAVFAVGAAFARSRPSY